MTPDDTSLADLRFSLVGPGRVGSSLAHWACACGARLAFVAGSRSTSAEALARILGGEATDRSELTTRGQELLLLALPDHAYGQAAEELARRPQARVVLHTSGSLAAAVLDPLRAAGSATGSLHPLKAFPRALPERAEAAGTFFALDGSPDAIAVAERLVAAWEGQSAVIEGSRRLLYHFAGTLAAGGVGTLMATVWSLVRRLRLPEASWPGYLRLARGALDQIEAARPPASAITGPAARGDDALVARELQALEAIDPQLAELTRQLWKETRRRLEDT